LRAAIRNLGFRRIVRAQFVMRMAFGGDGVLGEVIQGGRSGVQIGFTFAMVAKQAMVQHVALQ